MEQLHLRSKFVLLYWPLFGLYCTLLFSCEQKQPSYVSLQQKHSDEEHNSVGIDYAIGFDLKYKNDYKILRIFNHYQETKDTIHYLLLPANAAIPEAYKHFRIIRTPIKKLITMSSTHIGLVDVLQAQDVIIGHSNRNNIWSKAYLERVKNGQITEVGRDININTEVVLSLNPDVVMAVGLPGKSHNAYSILEEAGISVIYNAEWQENSLLGRSEWVKLMAALLNKEDTANHVFHAMVKAYDSLKRLTSNVTTRPMLIGGVPVKGTWHVPGGNSYITKLIHDAGGDNQWKETKETGNIVVSFEDVFMAGLDADIWINVRASNNKEELLNFDPRLKDFKAYKAGEIYNFTKREAASGANDYWETGIVYPNYILADMIKIIHPELLPDYELFFYKKIE